ncbi:MAG: hypothetical protein ACRERD_09975 [Candidatus Binatia bacterium]
MSDDDRELPDGLALASDAAASRHPHGAVPGRIYGRLVRQCGRRDVSAQHAQDN